MLNGCGAHLLRCLQQGYARFLGVADEFTRASGPHIHEYAAVRFALRLASGLPHSFNTRLLAPVRPQVERTSERSERGQEMERTSARSERGQEMERTSARSERDLMQGQCRVNGRRTVAAIPRESATLGRPC